ncbi:MAG: SAM-dependent methyltransferase [Acidimicrobiia bacterium]
MTTLKTRLLERISNEGPVPFEEYHRAALYDPEHGFFTSGSLRSAEEGDFLTSPEVSPLFGETLAEFARRERERLDDPGGFAVVDAGAGSGSLLRWLLQAEPLEAWAVELSQAARQALRAVLPADRVVPTLDDLSSPVTGVVFANELLDNQPVALAVRSQGGWEERWVGTSDGGFELIPAPARAPVVDWCDQFAGPVPDGGLVEVQLEAGKWLRMALSRLAVGSVVVIDYGDTATGLLPRRAAGTLRTYRSHHIGPDPLLDPGSVDVTVDVNFTALLGVAEEAANNVQLMRQEEFLTDLGLREQLRQLRHQELELARSGDDMARLEVRSLRVGAETLLHPRGLGDFRVLVARL